MTSISSLKAVPTILAFLALYAFPAEANNKKDLKKKKKPIMCCDALAFLKMMCALPLEKVEEADKVSKDV